MNVRFWGTRGSIAKPGPSTVQYGGNTSCVSVDVPGHDPVLFDLFLTSGIYRKYAEKFLKPEQIDEVDISKYVG